MNNHDVLELVYTKHWTDLVKACYRICEDYDLAKDIVQEAFIIALTTLNLSEDTLDPRLKTISFLRTIITNLTIRSLRRKNVVIKNTKDVTSYLYSPDVPKQGIFDYYPLDKKVVEGINQLKEMDRIAVIAYMYDLPLGQIAKIYGVNDIGIYQRLKKAFKQLKSYSLEEEILYDDSKKARTTRSTGTDEIYRLRQEGWTFSKIAKYFKTTYNNVAVKYYERLKKMKKYPEVYKDVVQQGMP